MTHYNVTVDGRVSCGFISIDVARAVALAALVEWFWAVEVAG
jgi:hypothetical protein